MRGFDGRNAPILRILGLTRPGTTKRCPNAAGRGRRQIDCREKADSLQPCGGASGALQMFVKACHEIGYVGRRIAFEESVDAVGQLVGLGAVTQYVHDGYEEAML